MQCKGHILTDKGSMLAYLRLKTNKLNDKSIKLLQPAFIEQIINQVNLKDERLHDTLADQILHRDVNGEE